MMLVGPWWQRLERVSSLPGFGVAGRSWLLEDIKVAEALDRLEAVVLDFRVARTSVE